MGCVAGKSSNGVRNAGGDSFPSRLNISENGPTTLGAAADGIGIKRVVAPIEKEEGDGNAAGIPDVHQGRAPSYHVRKSVVNARVRIGSEAASMLRKKYDLSDDILGAGVSGIVRIATDKNTGEQYAVKILSLENIPPKKAAMVHNEVDIYLKLDHPNIATLVEVFEDETAIFLVMELCTGRELYDRLATKRRYSEEDARRVTRQMLEAISYCHSHRICHRDLKLENWVYADPSEDAELKLIDFGFSRIFNPVIPMTAMHGTVYYVSPEVMDGCYREKCDVWSIGVIVYMLLSGIPPFNGTVDYQILVKIRNARYDFNAPVWSTISDKAKEFISALLVKDPNVRLSAPEALNHPWLAEPVSEADREIPRSVLESMREFSRATVFKRAALNLVAYSFTSNEIRDLQKYFRQLDPGHTGVIKMGDFVAAVTNKLHISEDEAEKIFSKIDYAGDHEVNYSCFLASALHGKLATDERWIRDAFDRLDADKNGSITVKDLRDVLGDSFGTMPVENLFDSVDVSKTGDIDYAAFSKLLKENSNASSDDESTPSPKLATSGDHKVPIESRSSFSNAIVELQLRE